MGIAGSMLGFFFGAVAGTIVFGAVGAAIGFFAARDVEDLVEAVNTKHPEIRSLSHRVLRMIGRGLYLFLGVIVIWLTKLFGLFRK